MQINQIKEKELGLLIAGLRAIYIVEEEPLRARLQEQLERELLTRYGKTLEEKV